MAIDPSIIYDRIYSLLEGHLESYSGLPLDGSDKLVAWPNVMFEPKEGSLWIMAEHIPLDQDRVALFENGYTRLRGLFVAHCRGPWNGGAKDVGLLADGVRDRFKSGQTLDPGNYNVRLIGAQMQTGVKSDGWYEQPVTVRWIAHASGL